ncbi:MAG: enolase C-terminal domain-like protein [Pseudomonadota bacterium]
MTTVAIDRIRVYAVTPEETPEYQFSGTGEAETPHYVIVRVTTQNGIDGIAGSLADANAVPADSVNYVHDFVQSFEPVAEKLLNQEFSDAVTLTDSLAGTHSDTLPYVESLLDIALWDLAAKRKNLALYQYLGGYQDRIAAYASSPVLDTVEDYLKYVDTAAKLGFPAMKFHMQGNLAFDLEMVTAVSQKLAESDTFFMVDMETAYDFDSALKLGEALAKMPCEWLEAPFPDHQLDHYIELRQAIDIDVIPDGNAIVDAPTLTAAIQRDAWSRMRCDASNAGGLTAAKRIMELAQAKHLKIELQCYGYPLTQAANLHLMLGLPGCTYFEQPVPLEHYDYGTPTPLRIAMDGTIGAPAKPGLGIEMDWHRVEADASSVLDLSQR